MKSCLKSYLGSEIRNVAVVGHAHSGKTTLVSALLHTAHMTPRLGHVEDGSAVTAYDEEEVARRTTMQAAVAFAEWNGIKANLVDTPGFPMFLHEARAAMVPVEAALVVVNTPSSLEPATERVWEYAEEFGLPRVVVLNQMDHPLAAGSVHSTVSALRRRFGRNLVPVQLPMTGERGFEGVVDLVTMQAFRYVPNGDGCGSRIAIPQPLREAARLAHEVLIELLAEGRPELLDEVFTHGTLSEDRLAAALHQAIRQDRIFPVLFSSGATNVGTDRLLEFLKVYAPSPAERPPVAARAVMQQPCVMPPSDLDPLAPHAAAPLDLAPVIPIDQEFVMRKVDDHEPPSLFVFKTMTDPFAGRISFFKVFSGVVRNDATLANYSRDSVEKLSNLYVMQGHTAVPVDDLHAGDLGAVARLHETYTCDSLGDKDHEIFFEPVMAPEAAVTWAIEPRMVADEDRLASALHKLMEEDLQVRFFRDAQTGELLIAGAGQPHIEAVVSKLRRRFRIEVILKSPRVPYRETIRAVAEAQGRHRIQVGGHGQFGDCNLRIEPLPRGSGIEFVSKVVGGAVPRHFIPAIERGVRDAAAQGFLAGYPVTDFRATVYDGSFREHESSELSFRMAGRLAFRTCMEKAQPVLLEPVMRVGIETPEECAGAVMSDLNQRRGRVQGLEGRGEAVVLRADVPMAELLCYSLSLATLTGGRGSFQMEPVRYDIVPAPIADRFMAGAKHLNLEYKAEAS